MWQSWVESEHYSALKIKFNACINAQGHYLHGSRSLVPLRMCVTSYGLQNTADFGVTAYCHISKNHQKGSSQGGVHMLGG